MKSQAYVGLPDASSAERRRVVEILWTNGEFPVQESTRKIFFGRVCLKFWLSAAAVDAPSYLASLDRRSAANRIPSRPPQLQTAQHPIVSTSVHRFHETIAGRPYLIEVAPVGADRWRACIVRIPGVPTALMPFYGPTPLEAAGELRQWLTRAHACAAGSPTRPTPSA